MKKGIERTGRSWIGSGLMLMIGLALLLLTSTAQAEKMRKFKHIRLSTGHGQGSFVYDSAMLFAKEAKALSDGTLNVVVYPSSQLYKDNEQPEVLKQGNLEIGIMNMGFFLGKVREQWVRIVPTYFEGLDHTFRYRYLSPVSDIVEDSYLKKGGIVIIGSLLLSPEMSILSTKPIASLDDFKGKKLRLPGPFFNVLFKELGSAPVTTSLTEVHMGLSRGTFDGVISFAPAFTMFKWYEVAPHFTYLNNFASGSFDFGMSQKFWKKLHPKQQKAVLEAAHKAELYCFQRAIEDNEKKLKIIRDNGVTMHRLNAADQQKMVGTFRPMIKPAILDRFGGKKLAPIALRAADVTRDIPMSAQQSMRVGYENRLKKWGLQ